MASVSEAPLAHFLNYFLQRGFSQEDVESLGAVPINARQIEQILGSSPAWNGFPAAALIPYVDRTGNNTEAVTVRILGTKKTSFGEVGPKVKAVSPPKQRPRAHFPRRNPPLQEGTTIYLCESVLKAEVVARAGKYAIGINGCWGYSDRNTTDLLLPDIRDLPWPLIKQVRIFFDSNIVGNDQVSLAAKRFAIRLREVLHFENTVLQLLPKRDDGADWGCDDACASMGREAFATLLEEEPLELELDEIALKLIEMNEQCCILEEAGQIVKYSEHPVVMMGRGVFEGVNYANWLVPDPASEKKVSIPRLWLTWPKVNKVPRAVMRPNRPKMVPGEFLNLWVDPELEAGEPSTVWKDFLDNMVPDDSARHWLNQWIAHLVQRPGEKMATYVILIGPQGVGKSMLTTAIEAILGAENCALIGQEDLEGGFNGLHAVKLFTAINEFYAKDQTIGNKLKRIVTETHTLVNPKYGRQFMVDSVCNYMITTNEMGALKLDEDDRRAAVVDCTPKAGRGAEFFERLAAEIKDNASRILGFYMEYDLSGFNPFGAAVKTEAKFTMTEHRRTVYEQVAWRLANEPKDILEELKIPTDVQYITTADLLLKIPDLQNERLNHKQNEGRMTQAMAKMGLRKWEGASGGQLYLGDRRVRVTVINGGDVGASPEVVRTHLKRMSKI